MRYSKLQYLVPVALLCLLSAACERDRGTNDPVPTQALARAGRVNVTVAAVGEGLITVRYPDGRLQQLQVESSAAVSVGMTSWCEEDCGRGLTTPAGYVRVLRVR